MFYTFLEPSPYPQSLLYGLNPKAEGHDDKISLTYSIKLKAHASNTFSGLEMIFGLMVYHGTPCAIDKSILCLVRELYHLRLRTDVCTIDVRNWLYTNKQRTATAPLGSLSLTVKIGC